MYVALRHCFIKFEYYNLITPLSWEVIPTEAREVDGYLREVLEVSYKQNDNAVKERRGKGRDCTFRESAGVDIYYSCGELNHLKAAQYVKTSACYFAFVHCCPHIKIKNAKRNHDLYLILISIESSKLAIILMN